MLENWTPEDQEKYNHDLMDAVTFISKIVLIFLISIFAYQQPMFGAGIITGFIIAYLVAGYIVWRHKKNDNKRTENSEKESFRQ